MVMLALSALSKPLDDKTVIVTRICDLKIDLKISKAKSVLQISCMFILTFEWGLLNHLTAAGRFKLIAVAVVCHEIVFNVSTFGPTQSKHHSVNGLSQERICTSSSYQDVVSFLGHKCTSSFQKTHFWGTWCFIYTPMASPQINGTNLLRLVSKLLYYRKWIFSFQWTTVSRIQTPMRSLKMYVLKIWLGATWVAKLQYKGAGEGTVSSWRSAQPLLKCHAGD